MSTATRKPLVSLPSRAALERKLELLIRDAREVRLLLSLATQLETEDQKPVDLDNCENEFNERQRAARK